METKQYIGDGIELSADPILRAFQLRREAERLERKAARNPMFSAMAKEARADYERYMAEWASK